MTVSTANGTATLSRRQESLIRKNEQNAAAARANDADAVKIFEERNRLLVASFEAGISPHVLGPIHGLSRQTVWWVVATAREGREPKARTGRQRGLKSGGRPNGKK